MKVKKISAINFIILISLIISIILSVSVGFYWYLTSKKTAENDINTIKTMYINSSKQYARSIVQGVIKTIDNERKEQIADTKKEVMVNQTIYKYLERLYMIYRGEITKNKIKRLLRRHLIDKTFSNPSKSYYIFDKKGNCIVNPYNMNAEGKNFINLKDFKGNYIIKNIIKKAKIKNEDFINQYFPSNWYDLNPESIKQKGITFVKYYKPFDWILVTIINTKYLEEQLKQKWLNIISLYQYGENNHNYVFVIKLLNINGGECFGKMLINTNRPDLINKCMSDEYKDVKGVRFRKLFLQDIKNKGYSFVEYYYKIPNSDKIEKKVSYFKLYKPWKWILATGLYLQDLKPIINAQSVKTKSRLNSIKQTIMLLILFVITIALLFSFILMKTTKRYINILFNELDKSLKYSKLIDKQKYRIKEVRDIIDKFNNSIKQIKNYENRLKDIALHDELTGLHNRRFLSETEDLVIKSIKRSGKKLGILMCDIDFFKKVNDTYGHDAGDEVLKSVAQIMTKSVRESDVVIRFGGEEFLILLMNADKNDCFEIAENIRKRIEKSSIKINNQSIRITISIGISEFSANEKNFEKAIKLANLSLYEAKNSGRNKTMISENES